MAEFVFYSAKKWRSLFPIPHFLQLNRLHDNIPNAIPPNAKIPNAKIPNAILPNAKIPNAIIPNMPIYPMPKYPMPVCPIVIITIIILMLTLIKNAHLKFKGELVWPNCALKRNDVNF